MTEAQLDEHTARLVYQWSNGVASGVVDEFAGMEPLTAIILFHRVFSALSSRGTGGMGNHFRYLIEKRVLDGEI